MSYLLSDEESVDSDTGVRFKTESTRKPANDSNQSRRRNDQSYESQKSYSSRHRDGAGSKDRKYSSRDRHRKSRSRSAERYRHRRSTSRSIEYESRYRREDRQYKSREYSRHEKYDRYERDHYREKHNYTEKYPSTTRSTIRSPCSDLSSEDESKNSISSEDNNFDKKNYSSSQSRPNPVLSKEACGPMVSLKSDLNIQNNQDSKVFGPKIPSDNIHKKKEENTTKPKETNTYGPTLPETSKNDSNGTNINAEIDNTNVYGPVLPTVSSKKSSNNKSSDLTKYSDDSNLYGPVYPTNVGDSKSTNGQRVYEPCKPTNTSKSETESSNSSFGPALPPGLQKQVPENIKRKKVIGPTLPAHLKSEITSNNNDEGLITSQEIQNSDSGEDDDMIGPLPEGHSSKNISHKLLEERALEMRINALNPVDTAPRREEWMTELPDVHRANLGLGPRQFRSKEGPDMSDRSTWTDTPEDKAKKLNKGKTKEIDIKEKSKLEYIHKRDKEQEEIAKKHKKNKKREKSLVEMHQEKLNKKKKEESSIPKERRPFDRDIDLKVNRFDEAQKKAVLKKAQLLDTRFSSGESKFL